MKLRSSGLCTKQSRKNKVENRAGTTDVVERNMKLPTIKERKRCRSPTVTPQALAWDGSALWMSELMRNLVAAMIISYLPAGQSAFAHLTPAAKRAATDTSALAVALGQQLGLAIVVGAMIGWLGAWALLRFQPPREPPVK